MAIFSNQATLTYQGTATNSNVVFGEILDVLTVTKTAVEDSYSPGGVVTYAVALRNTGNTALSNLQIVDDLGAYEGAGTTLTPLTYASGSATLFLDGVLQPAPTVSAESPLTFSTVSIPAGSDLVLVYQATANSFAPPEIGGLILNTVTVTGVGLAEAATASAEIPASSSALLSISKTLSPSQVVDNERITYSFIIQNSGNQEVLATDDAVVSDTFDPILSDLTVTLNGVALVQGTDYLYDEATGRFSTVAGQITVPAATYIRDPDSGAYTAVPGVTTLVVSGIV